jgi:predicted ATPase/DNA-binding CsgD family transcriptional regulator
VARTQGIPKEVARHNLPPQRTSLIGRGDDVARIRRLVLDAPGRLVTLTGAGGCGKTRVGVAVAADLAESCADGVRLIELASLRDPQLVPQAIATTLNVRERAGRSLSDSVIAWLAQRQMLLVLDNCEHLVAACATIVDRLLEACVNLRVLTTSREPLRITGEVTWRVPSLAVPDAVQLFVERAQAVQPNFKLTSQNASAVAAICSRLDGLPLAIELAAAWERALGADEILPRLDDAFRLLVGGSRTAPTRQQTMWATLDWSHTLLTEAEQQLFRRLAIFAGGWNLAAAEAVCAGGQVTSADVLPGLTRLVDTSLVLAEESGGRVRYRLLEPVRAFGAEYLARSGEAEAMGEAHASYFREYGQQLATNTRDDPAQMAFWRQRLELMELDYQNFRLALELISQRDPVEPALRLANVLAEMWQNRAYLSEGRTWLTRLLQRTGINGFERARATGWLGNLARLQGDPVAAQAWHAETLAIDLEIGDEAHAACTLAALGRDALTLGNYQEAERLLEDALTRLQALGTGKVQAGGVLITGEEVWAIYGLGLVAYEQQDWARAHALYTRCQERAMTLPGPYDTYLSMAEYGLARVAEQQGDNHLARTLYEAALRRQRRITHPVILALTLVGLGQVLLAENDLMGARAALDECLVTYDELGDSSGVARALESFAALAIVERQPERAWRLIGAAEHLRSTGHAVQSPADKGELARLLEPARGMLDEETVAALREAGRNLSIEQAMALARESGVDRAAESAEGKAVASNGVLTPRELEVAVLVGRGLSNRQISEHLIITRRTAAAHVGHILTKLGVNSRTQVGVWAAEHGLLG